MPCNQKHPAANRERMLSTRCNSCIKNFNDWNNWADTDARKSQLLKSRCVSAIEQVQTWGTWANTANKRQLVRLSQCSFAIAQLSNHHAIFSSDSDSDSDSYSESNADSDEGQAIEPTIATQSQASSGLWPASFFSSSADALPNTNNQHHSPGDLNPRSRQRLRR